jgi:sterol desaturase/sphingolipid hydroxylase (fatty acid hydroxylase superfamily)
MTVTYERAVSFAVPVFLTLIAAEFAADRLKGTRYYGLADAINSLSCGMVSTCMRAFCGFFALFSYQWVYQHVAPIHLSQGHWAVWVLAFVLYDFCFYWLHRVGHTVNLGWAAHVVHHQSEEFNLTTALRQSGTDSFLAWMFYMPLALAGVPMLVFLFVGLAQMFYQFWPHTQLIHKLGFLDRWVQTPSNHRVHHAQNDAYLDKNYVGVFLIWDRLFGTYQEELENDPCIFGIRGQLHSWNPVWANLHYYWAMAQDAWHARSWRDKIKVWFMNPGWRPADVAARFPKKPYDPRVDFVKFDPPRNVALSAYGLAQFTVLVVAFNQLLALLPKESVLLNVGYFLWLVISLACLGGVLESRREFLFAEAVRLLLTAVVVLAHRGWFGNATQAYIVIPIAVFAPVSLIWLWLATRGGAKPAPATAAA